MKTLKFSLFAMLMLSMAITCSEDNTSGTDNLNELDLLKSQLNDEWVVANQKNSYIYAFAYDDTIYVKTPEGNTVSKWSYLPVAEDSIRIIRHRTTHNKIVFYSGDSIWISDFISSDTAMYPPEFTNAVLKRRLSGNKESEADCRWEQVTPITSTNEQKSRLDYVFSDDKESLRNIKSDTLFVINNREDMVKLQGISEEYPDPWMEFDWDNQSIIGGKISTSSVSDEVLSQQLLECLDTSSYKYEIEVKKCTNCWTAIGYHYFWAIYLKKPNTENVSLTIKTVE
jgi:hypothetical protein